MLSLQSLKARELWQKPQLTPMPSEYCIIISYSRLATTKDDTRPVGSAVVDCTRAGWSCTNHSSHPASGKNLRTVSADSCQLSRLAISGCSGIGACGNQVSDGTGWPR